MKQSLDVFKSFIERLLIAIKKKYILCTEYCVSPNILQTLLKLLKIVLSDTKLMQTSRLTNLVSILKRLLWGASRVLIIDKLALEMEF